MNKIKNIVFDIGNVLLRWDPHPIIEKQMSKEIINSIKKHDELIREKWFELDKGSIEIDDMIKFLSSKTGTTFADMNYLMNRLRESLRLMEDSFQIVVDLDRQDFDLFCLSNMSLHFWEYLEKQFRINWKFFKGIVISAKIKSIKPEPEIYQYLLNKYGLNPDQTIFIDDVKENTIAANKLGIKAIHFINANQCQQQIMCIIDDQPTIQEGINSSSNGDTVLVHSGTYIETINY